MVVYGAKIENKCEYMVDRFKKFIWPVKKGLYDHINTVKMEN